MLLYIAMGLWGCFFTVLGGWYGSNRPMTAFQAVSSSIEAVLDALFSLETLKMLSFFTSLLWDIHSSSHSNNQKLYLSKKNTKKNKKLNSKFLNTLIPKNKEPRKLNSSILPNPLILFSPILN